LAKRYAKWRKGSLLAYDLDATPGERTKEISEARGLDKMVVIRSVERCPAESQGIEERSTRIPQDGADLADNLRDLASRDRGSHDLKAFCDKNYADFR
jgi:hypothetical protein